MPAKADTLAALQKEILHLEGQKPFVSKVDVGLGFITKNFPNACFPAGGIHEFVCDCTEDQAASSGFIAGVLSSLMNNHGVSIWISSSQTIFPPSLAFFGIEPDKIIFINLRKEKQVLWAMEEALKCDALSGVVGELAEPGFTASRRFQLAVEASGKAGFIVRRNPKQLSTACNSRWKISPLPGKAIELPGLGFPSWEVELLKLRYGRPGKWQLEWSGNKFRKVNQPVLRVIDVQQKQTG